MTKIIDAHIHTAFHSPKLRKGASIGGINYSITGLKREMAENNVQYAVSMGLESSDCALLDPKSETPMVDGIHDRYIIPVGGINPYKIDNDSLSRIENMLSAQRIKGLKIYLGYYHKHAYDDAYKKIYDLAAKYRAPVIFHTGDNYDDRAKLKYAHPLTIDEVAVDFRGTRFVIAHIGNPWTIDAAEVIYKNGNVYGDLSGLFLADRIDIIHDRDIEGIIKAYRWVYDPGKFLYGSDWPLIPMKPYIRIIDRILREATSPEIYDLHFERVFYLNAKELFNLESV
jgi:hypothetical protein